MATRTASPVPLESGDHLSRREFHRRYLARPDIKRAELNEGVVYVSSPVSADHSVPHSRVVGWLFLYGGRTSGVELADNGTLLIDAESEVQPDAFLYREPPLGRIRVITKERGTRYFEGVPDLAVEVAASSASYDLHSKLRLYERLSVPEYVVWQVYERRIDWFRLTDGRYVRVEPDERGVIESSVFPGLRLAVAKLLAGDVAGVIAELLEAQR